MLPVCSIIYILQEVKMFESDHDLFDSSLDEAEVRAGCENVDTLNSMERLGITDHNKPQEVVKQSAGQIGVKSETCGGKSETCDAKSEVCGSLNASILCCKSDICTDMCVTCKEIITEREKALQLSKVDSSKQYSAVKCIIAGADDRTTCGQW